MINKKLIVPAIFLVFLLAVSAVSASDNATDDIVASTDGNAGLDESNILNEVSTGAQSNSKSFTDLTNYINDEINKGHTTINLTDNYIFNDGDTVPNIYASIEINGNGATIDGNHSAPIFGVYDGITFRNITFINGESYISGSAISASGNGYYTVINCTFINNHAGYGGALAGNGQAENCTFISNTADNDGGAMIGGSATNCRFIGNTAGNNGGALVNVTATGCNFSQNFANVSGGAMSGGSASSCIFTDNMATNDGGAMLSGVADSCQFIYNIANCGGALSQCNATNSTFVLNRAISNNTDVNNTTLDSCNFPVASFNVSNYFKTWARSGEMLFLNLTYDGNKTLNGINTTITVYGPNGIAGQYSCLSGQGWAVNFEPGKYNATLSIDYANFTPANITLNIVKPTVISLNNPINPYNGNVTLDIALLDWDGEAVKGSHKVNVFINSTKEYYTDENGKVSVPIDGLEPNYYTAKVSFEGDDDFNASNASCEIAIVRAEPNIWVEDLYTTVGTYNMFYILLKDNRGWGLAYYPLTIDLNGSIINEKTQADAIVEIGTSYLGVGNYTVKISYGGNNLYREVNRTAYIIVNKISTNLNASDVNVTVGSDDYLIVNLTDDNAMPLANATVTVDLNGISNYTTNATGQFNISTVNLPAGKYVAKIAFNGTDVYNETSILVNVTINKFPTILIADDLNTTYGSDDYLVVTLEDGMHAALANATVTVDLNTISNYTTNETGQFAVSLKNLNATTYYVNVTYAGDETRAKSAKTVKIIVDKIDSSLNVTDIEFGYNQTGSLNVSFAGADGVNATIANQTGAIINVNGNVITVSGLTIGSYAMNVTTIPDTNHNPVTRTANVVVTKVNSSMTLSDVECDYGTVTEVIVPVQGAVGITATIDGVNASVRNNTVIIPDLNAGNYTLSVTTIPDEYHNAITKSVNLTVRKLNSSLTLSDVSCDYGSTNNVIVQIQGAIGITAKIGDANASVKDNSVLISGLDVGNYTLTVTTLVDANHNSVTKTANVTVRKIDSTLVLLDVSCDYGSLKGIAVITGGALGITAKIDGSDAKVEGNEVMISDLNVGNYTLEVTTVPDANHNAVSKTANLSIRKVDSSITVNDVSFDYGSLSKVSVQFDGATAITAKIDGADAEVTANEVIISNLDAGNYTLEVTTVPDANHRAVSATSKINIRKVDSSLTVGDVAGDYGSLNRIAVHTQGADAITAKINGADANVSGFDVLVSGLDVGDYTLEVTTVPDANHNAASATSKITVRKVDSSITVNDVACEYGSSTRIIVHSQGAVAITAKINGEDVSVSGNEVLIPDLDVGNYTLEVTTIADANHNPVTKSANVEIRKADSSITLSDVVCEYGSSTRIIVHTQGAEKITAKINGEDVSVRDNAIVISGMDVGTYSLSVTTVPDANHNAVSKTVNVIVDKIKTDLSAEDITTTYNVNKNLVISLKDSQNRPIAGADIKVNFNGDKTYKTDENGQIKISTKGLAPKTYAVSISFAGAKNYKAASATANVEIKKATPKITAKAKTFKKSVKTKKYTITLKNNKNKVMKKTKVSLKVNGKKYFVKTNSKGKATFKITNLKKKAKYAALIKFAGNSYYKATSKKIIITVK